MNKFKMMKFRIAAFGGSFGTMYLAFQMSHGHHPGHPFI